MSSVTLSRLSGQALIVGSAIHIIGFILSMTLYAGHDPHQYLTASWVIVTLVDMTGALLLLMGSLGLIPHLGLLGLSGVILLYLGGFLFTSLDVTSLLLFPWLAQTAPKLLAGPPPASYQIFFPIAGMLFTLGGLLLGIGAWRAKLLPVTGLALFLAGVVLSLVRFPLQGVLSTSVTILTIALYVVAVGWIGYSLVSQAGKQAESAQAAAMKVIS